MVMKCGLISEGEDIAVPLKNIDVSVSITGYIADVKSKLVYNNDTDKPLEAVFVFPLDEQSAVYKFEAHIQDRHIIAEIQDKDQARKTYDEAISKGHTAALMEESDPTSDVFTCKIGNIPQKADASLTFSFVIELPIEVDGGVKFVMPTVLNPRYNPTAEKGGAKSTPADDIPYVCDNKLPYTLNFFADINSTHRIQKIDGGKDRINTSADTSTSSKVTLADEYKFDHDITIYVYYEDTYKPQAILEKGDDKKTGILTKDVVMLNFFPEVDTEATDSKKEFVFLIDRSGSMQGSRIESAREALLLFLRSLPIGCYFNVVGYGSQFVSMFSESKEYNKANLKEAINSQEGIYADLGGTEVLQPLQHVYSKPVAPGCTREIFLITDGDVWNVEEVMKIVKKNLSTTRVFSIGIGEGASTALVKGVSRAGRGKAIFVSDNERLNAKVINLLKCAMQASVIDAKLTWNLPQGVKASQLPDTIPPLFGGDKLILYTLLENKIGSGEISAELSGNIKGQVIKHTLKVDMGSSNSQSETAPIHRLAAKATIKDLATKEADEGFESQKEAITAMSMTANIISEYTSFVAVDKTVTVDGEMVSTNIPRVLVEPQRYWGMSAARSANLMPMSSCFQSSMMRCGAAAPPPSILGRHGAAPPTSGFIKSPAFHSLGAGPPPPPPPPGGMMRGFGGLQGAAPPPPPPAMGRIQQTQTCRNEK